MGNDSGSASYALRRLASPSASYAPATRRNAAAAALRSASERVVHLSGCHVAAARRYARRIDARVRVAGHAQRAVRRGDRRANPAKLAVCCRSASPRLARAPARRLGGELARRAVQRFVARRRVQRGAHVLERAHIVSYRSPQTRAHAARLDVSGVDQKALAQIARRDAKRSARTRRRLIIAVVRLLRLIIVRVARRVLCGLRSVRSARHAETVHVHIHVLVQRVEDGLRAPAQQIAARRVRVRRPFLAVF